MLSTVVAHAIQNLKVNVNYAVVDLTQVEDDAAISKKISRFYELTSHFQNT